MIFYGDYSFYILLIVAIIPAAILGVRGKRLSYYGFGASCAFLVLLFYKTPLELCYFLLFLALQLALIFFLLKQAQKGMGDNKAGSIGKVLYRCCLAASIAPLAIYKVSALFDSNLLGFLGISYITFKSVQVIIEVYDGLIKDMTLFECLYFLVFFPPFTSGPIDRSRRFIDDIHKCYTRDEYLDLLGKGMLFIVIGLFYKAVLSAICFKYYAPMGFESFSVTAALWQALSSAYAYGFYLFFDFAGYSLMAIGASYCFGIMTPKNFNAPFKSLDIKEFWNRWHMTLSFWLRDFIFMRFAMAATKHKWFSSRLTTACLGYLTNMTVMGFWHGITPGYVGYGIYHGALLALTELYQKKSKFHKRYKNARAYKAFSWFVTFNLVMLGFAIFSGQVEMYLEVITSGELQRFL